MAEALDVADPAEKGFNIEQRRLLGEGRAGLMGGILQHDAEVFEKEAIAQRRFDADVGGDPGEHQWRMPRLRKMLSSGVLKKPL